MTTFRARAIAAAIAILVTQPSARSRAHAAVPQILESRGAILVQVTDTSLNPLPAEVMFPALGIAARASSDGGILVSNVPPGLYLVRVRHAGHATESRLLRAETDTVRVEVALYPAPDRRRARGGEQELDRWGVARARLHHFIRHGPTLAGAAFLTRAEVERREARTLSDLLRDTPGVRIGRGAGGRVIVRSTEVSGSGCANGMRVFLDGAELPRPTDSVSNAAAVPRGTDLDRVDASSVLAIEVYPLPGAAPPELQLPGPACGTVVIWTATA